MVCGYVRIGAVRITTKGEVFGANKTEKGELGQRISS